MTVVYDNNPGQKKLIADWGFSCLIQGLEKTILFDTGSQGKILLENMDHLNINPTDIDIVLLSHFHRDHTGGLEALLDKCAFEVWIPESFPLNFREHIQKKGSEVILTTGRQKIIPRAFTTGIIEGWIKEQSLVLESPQGLIIMTGCAHPRIINIIHIVEKQWDQNIYMALGGFHLTGFSDNEIREIIFEFQNLGIKKAGPCHCSGLDARRLFHEIYEENYISIAVGTTILIP